MTAPVRILPTPESIGADIAGTLLERIERARARSSRFLLGCPTGRTPRPIFTAMAQRLAQTPQDLSHVVLVMMDEYLVEGSRGLEYAPPAAPWSCHHFARVEIAERVNAALRHERRLPEDAIWFPDATTPESYDDRIAGAGGIDYFLLASGASDGHVAFNQPPSSRESRTRIIPLSEATRRDNLKTSPSFGTLDQVPRYGVSVGIATIAAAREAAMVVWGSSKAATLARIRSAHRYDPDWPATVIHECARAEVVGDAEAAGEAGRS